MLPESLEFREGHAESFPAFTCDPAPFTPRGIPVVRRVTELDGLRGIAILLVLGFHFLTCRVPDDAPWMLGRVADLFGQGWNGVDLFFVLSGYLIVGILLRVKDSGRYFRTFYVRRACRILPLYYLMIGLYLLGKAVGWAFECSPQDLAIPFWSYPLFLQNLFMHDAGFGREPFGLTWSLAIEEQFYLVIPLLVRLCTRRRLAAVFLLGILAAPIWRWQLGNLGAYVYPMARADAILLGGLLAVVLGDAHWRTRLERRIRPLQGATLVMLAGSFVFLWRGHGIGGMANHFWFSLMFGLLLLVTVLRPRSWWSRRLRNPVLVWWGLRSYFVYLFHLMIERVVFGWFGLPSPMGGGIFGWGPLLATLTAVVLCAELSFRYFERPFMARGSRLRY